MKIDVSISYENGQLHTRSEAANYSDHRPSIIVVSRGSEGDKLVEAIGEPFDIEMHKAGWERDKGSRTYTSFDPFTVERFDPEAATMIVFHLCHRAHDNLKPKRGLWRMACGLDKFVIRLKVPYYSRVPVEKREAFERNVRKRIGKIEIGD
jgi:hypothetical protein